MMGIKEQIEALKNSINKVQNITSQIQSIQTKVKDPDVNAVISDALNQFQEGIKDAEKGKLKDFSSLLNKIENLADGHENTSN